MGVPNNGPRIIRFEIACTSAWRTYRLHGVRIILRDRDSGVSQDLDWGRHTPRLACHHFNYIHPAQLSPSTTASCTPWLSSNRQRDIFPVILPLHTSSSPTTTHRNILVYVFISGSTSLCIRIHLSNLRNKSRKHLSSLNLYCWDRKQRGYEESGPLLNTSFTYFFLRSRCM